MSESAPLMISVSGLRGITGRSLTGEVAARFAGAFATWLAERLERTEGEGHGSGSRRDLEAQPVTVVIGRDGRAGGEEILRAAMGGLVGAGCRVLELDVAMTPTIGVAVDRHEADGGMVVTASHNPQQWNGLKCIVGGGSPAGAGAASAAAPDAAAAEEIITRFRVAGEPGGAGARTGRTGELESIADAAADHAHLVATALEMLTGREAGQVGAGVRVLLDSVNASGARAGRLLLESLGCRVLALNDSDSGVFPHPPEPLRENLVSVLEAVRSAGADVGFVQDPDGDRLAIIDEQGRFIGEEYTLALAARSVLEARAAAGQRGGLLAANLSTSRMIDDIAAGFDAHVLRTPVGEAHVVRAMKTRQCILGGEGNGGVIWPQVTFIRDSLSAMALVLALMRRTGQPISQLAAALPSYAIEKRKVDLPTREAAAAAVQRLAEAYSGEKVDMQDGVRVDFQRQRAWLHVRASNTEPIMRLIAEAPTEGEASALLDDAATVIR